jgi:hypothetical protein
MLMAGGSFGRMTFRKPVWDAERSMLKGGPSGDWLTYPPREASPGQKNGWPPPVAGAQPGNASSARGEYTCFVFGVTWTKEKIAGGWEYRLQVATDSEFENLVIDKLVADTPYRHTPPLAPGKYYWRARAERGAEATHWSGTGSFLAEPFF